MTSPRKNNNSNSIKITSSNKEYIIKQKIRELITEILNFKEEKNGINRTNKLKEEYEKL